MRLTSVTIRSYRIHRELTIPLDPARTLIGGLNEAGKSTLAEAIHRALFLRAKGTSKFQKAMVSTIHAGHPEVELSFEAHGNSYRLLKRFSGASGTTSLAAAGGETLQGDAAEARLAELLGVESEGGGAGSRDRAAQQWSHLWVRQGEACAPPSQFASEHKDTLLNRLQRDGGAVAMQSECDAAVANQVAEELEALFTNQGTPRANTDLARAIEADTQALANLERSRQTVAKVGQAMQDVLAAEETVDSATSDLQTRQAELVEAEEALLKISNLRALEQKQEQDLNELRAGCEALKGADAQVKAIATDIEAERKTLASNAAHFDSLKASEAQTAEALRSAEIEHQRTGEAARLARLELDLAAAHNALFEKSAARLQLAEKMQQVATARRDLGAVQQRLAVLPPVEAKHVKQLQQLERNVATAEAALNAMAAGVEVISADTEVTVGGHSLGPGQSTVLTEMTDVVVGSARLRIQPGGGSRLKEARAERDAAHEALVAGLAKADVTSALEAAEFLAKRQQLLSAVDKHEAKLQGLGAGKLEAETAAAEQECAAAEALVQRKARLVSEFTAPPGIEEARLLVHRLEHRAEETRVMEEAQHAALRAARATSGAAVAAVQAYQQSLQKQKDAVTTLNAQLALLVATHGEEAARTAAIASAVAAISAASDKLDSTRQMISSLQPNLREADQKRLQRAIQVLMDSRNTAHTKRAVALTLLQNDGSTDPQAALALAQAQVESANLRRIHVQRRANALKLLGQLFTEERRVLAEHFTRPLGEKIGSYLECMFGNGIQVKVSLGDGGELSKFEVVRPAAGAGTHEFEVLSGGTKEQVAAAVRLAMAEVLAQSHDGCLPIVFDDAFAYSDPQRVKVLQRMLDLAAEKGLQVIVLTCNPADYAGLGATMITLS